MKEHSLDITKITDLKREIQKVPNNFNQVHSLSSGMFFYFILYILFLSQVLRRY